MARGSVVFVVVVIAAAAAARLLTAGVVTVKSGVVEKVAADGKTISVKFAHADEATDVSIAPELTVLLDGKRADLTAIKPGMSVTVEIDNNVTGRIIGHTAKEGDSAPKTPRVAKTPKPKSTAKSSTTHKSTKTAKKSGKSKKTENALDALPTATTPLAGLKSPAGKSAGGGGGSWPGFLGANRDNQSQETGLLKEWPPEGPPAAWPAPTTGLGQGYSAVSVANGLVFTMGTPGGQESVLAIDLEKGTAKWSVPTGGAVFQNDQGNGPRGTPSIDGEYAYALGAMGDLVCIDMRNKEVRWHKNLRQDFGSPGLKWGFSESPLIDGPRLICTPGAPGAMMVALNKLDGKLEWRCQAPGNPQPGYASPILADVAGTRQYITYTAAGVVGVRANDGVFLWGNDTTAHTPANCSNPLLLRDFVFVSSAYNGGGALLQLASSDNGGVQAKLVYHTNRMNSHHGGMVCIGSNLYGANGDILTCLNLERNEIAWQRRSVGKASITYADGNLYVRSETGPVALVEATPDGYQEKGRFTPPTSGNDRAWAYPVVAAGRLFLRDEDGLACYSLRDKK